MKKHVAALLAITTIGLAVVACDAVLGIGDYSDRPADAGRG